MHSEIKLKFIEYPCLESMSLMINCMKSSDYNEEPCQPQIKDFLDCFKNYNVKFC